jgi:putative ABC transport system substrate-binding protein
MKRRTFIAGLGSAAATWPLAARGQQPKMPVIGYLHPGSPESSLHVMAAFNQGLAETSYAEGRNVAIEFRWANDQFDPLPQLASDLVRRQVAVIVAASSLPAVLAAKAATTTIPIVFSTGVDPVEAGLVDSYNRPGSNVTGITGLSSELAGKQLGLLHQIVPGAARFALLINPANPISKVVSRDAQAAASALGVQVETLSATTNRDIDVAFATFAQSRVGALLVGPDPLFLSRRVQLAILAVKYMVPTIHFVRDFPDVGGLMSYGPSFADVNRQTGIYAGRILKGEKPGELPVMQTTKFEFVINLGTAKVLGLTIPETLLATADEVIQ